MTDETTQKDTVVAKEVTPEVTSTTPKTNSTAPASIPRAPYTAPTADGTNRGGGDFKKNRRQTSRRPRQRQEFDQRIISLRRVTRVSSGGRRFSFSVAIVIGDQKGRIGVGTGKAGDTALAIEKAVTSAKKNMITVKMTPEMSIPHEVNAKYCSGVVKLMPAPGRGIIAGSAVRDMAELAGIQNINGKILCGTKNKLNIARATIKALESLKTPYIGKKKKAVKEVEVSVK